MSSTLIMCDLWFEGLEMALVPMADYLMAADYLMQTVTAFRLPQESIVSSSYSDPFVLFVSSEDPEAVTTAQKWHLNGRNWTVVFTSTNLYEHSFSCLTCSIEFMSLKANNRSNLPLHGLVSLHGGVNEMLNSLLNLQV